VARVLLLGHLKRLVRSGPKGLWALAALMLTAAHVVLCAAARAAHSLLAASLLRAEGVVSEAAA
jgi:hypothetical protein